MGREVMSNDIGKLRSDAPLLDRDIGGIPGRPHARRIAHLAELVDGQKPVSVAGQPVHADPRRRGRATIRLA